MWSAGIAAASAVVVSWRIVGPGFVRLSSTVLLLIAAGAALAGGDFPAWAAVGAATVALMLASRVMAVVALMSAAAALLVIGAMTDSTLLPVLTGAALLGAITAEMVLGHWYLVDPQLPRWALQALAFGSGVALVAELAYFLMEGVFGWTAADAVIGWAFVALTVLSGLLIMGVSLSLREPSYTAVMAATGLSYLAVISAFGVAVLGRTLVV